MKLILYFEGPDFVAHKAPQASVRRIKAVIGNLS